MARSMPSEPVLRGGSPKGSRLALGRDQRNTTVVGGAGELLALFRARFDVPVTIDNTARWAGLVEAIWGSDGRAPKHLLYVRLDQGVGGARVGDRSLAAGVSTLRGKSGIPPHFTSTAFRRISPARQALPLRKGGCLETIASVPAVLASCSELGGVKGIAHAAATRDRILGTVLHEVGDAVDRVLGGLGGGG